MIDRRPRDETESFCLRFLPPAPARVLEVGCGAGELAAALTGRGYSVVALDADPNEAAAARGRGVDAREARWPDAAPLPDERFDAVLFTRSLHHIGPLDGAVAAARASLRPGGRVLVEDFAFAAAPPAAAEWLRGVLRLLDAAGALEAAPGSFAARLLAASDAAAEWRHAADHDIHPAAAMEGSLAAQLTIEASERAPYLYRYVAPALAASTRGGELLARVLEAERAMAAAGALDLIGRRWVARAD
ncbi:MAG TPA: class I SAM-dependent methyltransferase [Gemmatimonadaceae bacterium]|nr:class I SAM-dependent methyltransferase [Gemmatimonadaceae bacterium]